MKAHDIMTSPAITVRQDATLEEAANIMTEKRVGGLPVVDDAGDLVGFVTDSDFAAKQRGVPFSLVTAPQVLGQWIGNEGIEQIYAAARRIKVKDIMAHPAIWANEDESLERVVRIMMEHDINRVVLVRDGMPIGIVARHDLLRLISRKGLPASV